ncbi:outer membrane beta-barrel protein [Fontivita pretiosa]|jgi:hypothetical protein|uniref:outer membrane beta-barrel protein n=1 Tax=Fontivita pretiosa TaxID=2989684 RepID=UPI003D170B96
MLRKLIVVGTIALLPTLAMAVPQARDWELTLSGTGGSDTDFEATSFGAEGELGYYAVENLELYLRQAISYADAEGTDSTWDGSTRVGAAYNFALSDDWRPYAGANIGYRYGDLTDDSWIAGLEAGLKYYVNTTTFVFGQVGYDFLLEESFGDGVWVYSLGIGFNF